MQFDVRHICGCAGSRLVVGAFDRDVEIWDIASGERISAFETGLDFGGRRLALSPKGDRLFVGAYQRHGVAAYDSDSGRLVWTRKDLKKIQCLSVSSDGSLLYCERDRSSLEVLHTEDGATSHRIRGGRGAYCSTVDESVLIEAKQLRYKGRTIEFLIAPESFAVLDCAFSSTEVCVSEAGGPVRCFSAIDGSLTWRVAQAEGHYLRLAYSPSLSSFVGVKWDYQRGGPAHLFKFTSSGQEEYIVNLGRSADREFCWNDSVLVESEGRVWDIATGQVLKQLPFVRIDQ